MEGAPLTDVDRILQRWAVSVSGGGYEPWANTNESKPPPLPEDLAVEVDKAILAAPDCFPTLIAGWYRTPKPGEVIAKECHLSSRQALYAKRREALFYLLGLFRGNGVMKRFKARTK